jgi:hypothetical protein
VASVLAVQLSHPSGKVAKWGFDNQVVVVPHQAVGIDEPAEPLCHLREQAEEHAPVMIVDEHELACVPAGDQMKDRAGSVDPQRPSHEPTVERHRRRRYRCGEAVTQPAHSPASDV